MTRRDRLLIFGFLAFAVFGLLRLRIDTDIVNLLPGGDAVTEGLRLYQDRFLQSGELLVTLAGADSGKVENAAREAARALAGATNLVRTAFWQPPARESLADSAYFLAYLWLNGPTQAVANLERALSPDDLPARLEETRERIRSSLNPEDLLLLPRDPLGLARAADAEAATLNSPEQFFSSADGTFRIVYVYAEPELKDYAQCAAWLGDIRALLRQTVPESSGLSFGLTGRPVFVEEISSGMRADMSTAAPGTLAMIALLFFIAHREWRSLGFLVGTLAVVMLATLAAGGAVLGSINVISIGFAAILLGLAEDFGVVLHQEAKSHPGAGAARLRKEAGPSVWSSAITTAAAFALLNLSALPGLRQLGTLIAIGILLGAWAMLYLFLPLVIRYGKRPGPAVSARFRSPRPLATRGPVAFTLALIIGAGAILWSRPMRFSASPDVLRPRKSEASRTLKLVQQTTGGAVEPLWLFVRGTNVALVRDRLERLDQRLAAHGPEFGIESFSLPLSVWPDPAAQAENRPALGRIAAELPRIRGAVLAAGFNPEAMELAAAVFSEWTATAPGGLRWPRGRIADWVTPKFVSRAPDDFIALGLIKPGPDFRPDEVVSADMAGQALVSGWSLMGRRVVAQVQRETPWICGAVALIVVLALWVTFRRVSGVLLSFAVLALSGLILAAAMAVLDWNWNLINLTALPLLLGMGIDYSIHMQSALGRFDGRSSQVRGIARALALAGSTSIIGFAFLGYSSNLGMASLGRVCALGLTVLLLVSIFLLPAWIELGARGAANKKRGHKQQF